MDCDRHVCRKELHHPVSLSRFKAREGMLGITMPMEKAQDRLKVMLF